MSNQSTKRTTQPQNETEDAQNRRRFVEQSGAEAASELPDLLLGRLKSQIPLFPGELTVDRARHSHRAQRRPMPRMLRRKLPSIVWRPSAVSVAPGITQRMVWA